MRLTLDTRARGKRHPPARLARATMQNRLIVWTVTGLVFLLIVLCTH